jgi:small neutral amino acid transporter SnatA (MarC family)
LTESAAGQANGLEARDVRWAKSVGNVAAPLLAGFSLTSVIVVSEDAGKFRWADAAIVSLAIAAVALIVAVQCSKYIHREYDNAVRWYGWTRISYHTGIVALLLGLAFVLAPLHAAGSPDAPRWVACFLAFAASAGEAIFFGKNFLCEAVREVISGK